MSVFMLKLGSGLLVSGAEHFNLMNLVDLPWNASIILLLENGIGCLYS